MTEREEIARLIAPDEWRREDLIIASRQSGKTARMLSIKEARQASLESADRILAAGYKKESEG